MLPVKPEVKPKPEEVKPAVKPKPVAGGDMPMPAFRLRHAYASGCSADTLAQAHASAMLAMLA
jgi:hypothetical protein